VPTLIKFVLEKAKNGPKIFWGAIWTTPAYTNIVGLNPTINRPICFLTQ
jgi:hypothetical protein